MTITSLKKSLPILIVLIAWIVFILPSCFYPNFSFLDDPITVYVSQHIFHNLNLLLPDGITGRYFPVYWLYYALVFALVGTSAQGFFIINSLLYLLILLLIYYISKVISNSEYIAAISVILCTTASPVAENIYTISKSEPRILFIILVILLLFIRTSMDKHNAPDKRKYVYAILIGFFCLIALFIKETAFIILLFPVFGLILTLILQEKFNNRNDIKIYSIFIVSGIIFFTVGKLINYLLQPAGSSSNYLVYTLSLKLIISNLKFYFLQQPDVIIFGLISFVLLILLYQLIHKNLLTEDEIRIYVIMCSIFAVGLGYSLLLLIWKWPLGYYTIISATIFSIVVSLTLYLLYRKTYNRLVIYFFILVILIARVYSITYFCYIAYTQKIEDIVYNRAIHEYITNAKANERLLVEQWLYYQEPVIQSNILVQKILNKKDLIVDGIADIINNVDISAQDLKTNNIAVNDNTKRIPNEGDYILVFTGDRTASWVLRAVDPFYYLKSNFEHNAKMYTVSTYNQKIRLPVINIKETPFIRIENVTCGYILYKVESINYIWKGRYADNWIGSEAELIIDDKKKDLTFQVEQPIRQALPNVLSIYNNNKIVEKIYIKDSAPIIIKIELSRLEMKDHTIVLDFKVDKTAIPKILGLNDDTRELGDVININKE